ncbi:MAG: DUF1295 domain-containing protein [Phycisphaeraceae bacterium]|nr:DUF1295 domain-containing protein [Phycisphaeraceae bacterium]
MQLHDHMVKLGARLFRWRSYLPLLTVGLFVWGFLSYRFPLNSSRADVVLEITCLGICFVGLLVRVLTVGFVPRGTSGRNTTTQKASRLNTTGMYSVVRHPLYLGNFLIWMGMILFFHDALLFITAALIYLVYYERIAMAEEQFLRESFGDQFESWAAKTPAIIPNFRLWVAPDLRFSWRTVLRRENNTFMLIIVGMTTLEVISDVVVENVLELEPMWISLLAPSVFLYIMIHVLKHYTRLLEVPGR